MNKHIEMDKYLAEYIEFLKKKNLELEEENAQLRASLKLAESIDCKTPSNFK